MLEIHVERVSDPYSQRFEELDHWYKNTEALYEDKGRCTEHLELKFKRLLDLLERCSDTGNYTLFDERFTLKNSSIDSFLAFM